MSNTRGKCGLHAIRRLGVLSGAVSLSSVMAWGAAGCSSEQDEAVELTELDGAPDALAWEDFKEAATRVAADGTTYYVVEWDIPLRTEQELKDYYAGIMSGEMDKGVVHLFSGTDDVWLNGDQRYLRYCVDTDPATGFDAPPVGVTAATMIDAMRRATAMWQQVANISFTYDSGNNGNCGATDPIPDARYIKISRVDSLASPCAFGPRSHSSWTCPGLDGNTIGVNYNYAYPGVPATDWPGVMAHELGHALGLHHEQFHTVGGGCAGVDVRNVTAAADLVSIMGYPAGSGGCALTTPSLTALSLGDGWTVRQFYGIPVSWYVVLW